MENLEEEIDHNNFPAIDETYPGLDESRLPIYMNTMAENGATDGVDRDPLTGQNHMKSFRRNVNKVKVTIGINHTLFKNLQEKKKSIRSKTC